MNVKDEDKEQKTAEEQKELAEDVEEAEIAEEKIEAPPEEEEEEKVAEEAPAEAGEVAVEEAAKPSAKKEKAEEEEEIVEEKIYTVPLSKAWIYPPNKRTPKAMRLLKNFVTKHMKLEKREEGEESEEEEEEPKRLIISKEVNEKVWGRGIEKPPRKIRVRAAKDKDGNVTVYLAEGD